MASKQDIKYKREFEGWAVQVTPNISLPGHFSSLLQAEKGLKRYLSRQSEMNKLLKAKTANKKKA